MALLVNAWLFDQIVNTTITTFIALTWFVITFSCLWYQTFPGMDVSLNHLKAWKGFEKIVSCRVLEHGRVIRMCVKLLSCGCVHRLWQCWLVNKRVMGEHTASIFMVVHPHDGGSKLLQNVSSCSLIDSIIFQKTWIFRISVLKLKNTCWLIGGGSQHGQQDAEIWKIAWRRTGITK